jgi:hypothetical protein
MKDEAFYKAKAEEARKLADRLPFPDFVQSWLLIAQVYETLAAAARSSQSIEDRRRLVDVDH